MEFKGIPLDVKMHLDGAQETAIGLPPVKKVLPFYKANQLDQEKKFEESEKLYKQLLNEDFSNGVVMAALGMNYAVRGEHGMANVLLSRALELFDSFEDCLNRVGVELDKLDSKGRSNFAKMKKSEIMNAIGTTWKHENKIDKARYWFEKAQNVLGSPNADIQNNLATLHINEGSPAKAMEHLDLAIKIDPKHSQAHWNRSLANLELGHYEAGFAEYGWGKRAEVRMIRNYSAHEIPEWDGSPGKTVIVYGEQGIGDEIMFASVLPEMIRDCKQVIFDCHKKLHRLFAASFPMIDIYPTREDENISWPVMMVDGKPVNRYPVDARIALGDVPQFYRKKIEDFPGFPYIRCTSKAEVKWGKVLAEKFADGKPVIGLNWIGGHKKTRVEVRSMTLEQWLPILKLDAHFVSLQYTEGCEDEISAFESKHGIQIHHWKEAAQSDHYDDAAGVVASLDLMLTCCSSVVHLAGSMGVPCWVLTPSRPAWRYRLDLDYMPWYGKTVTLFRQKHGSVEWEPVIEEVRDSLQELIDVRQVQGGPDRNGEDGGVAEAGCAVESDSAAV